MNTSVNIRRKETGKKSRAQQTDFCGTRKLLLANLTLFALILFLLNSSALTTTRKERQNGKDLVALKPATGSTASASTLLAEEKRQQSKEQTLLRAVNIAAESKLSLSSSSSSSSSSIESPMKVTTTDLILGMARNTDPKNFVVFCASLRETANSKAHVVIWVNSPVNKRIWEIASKFSINLIEYNESDLQPHLRNYHASTLRWILFYDYMSNPERQGKFGRIWMVDVRDTTFQIDPFGEETHLFPKGKGSSGREILNVFAGVENVPIGRCGWNSGWIRDCFGAKTLKQVEGNMIICSGVSAGTTKTVMKYLEYMSQLFDQKSSTHPWSGYSPVPEASNFPLCERNGVDQGAHNVLIHMKVLTEGEIKIWRQRNSPVLNLQAKTLNTVVDNVPVGNSVKNLDGKLAAVVHQYDRNENLQKRLFERYVHWINTSDPLNEWRITEECKAFNIVAEEELFKGICDIKHIGGATGPSTCCSLCLGEQGCKAFSFAIGTCFLKNCLPKQDRKEISMKGVYSAFLKD